MKNSTYVFMMTKYGADQVLKCEASATRDVELDADARIG